MSEHTRPRTNAELIPPAGGGVDTVWPDEEPGGLAQVGTGLYTERLPVVGMTIDDIRETFADRLDIDPGAQPVVDGQVVTDGSTRVEPGQRVAFVRHAGEKGVTAPWPDLQDAGITVATGLYHEQFPAGGSDRLHGRTVAGIRLRLRHRLDIDPEARAVINGEFVSDETTRTVTGGDSLCFVHTAGEMG